MLALVGRGCHRLLEIAARLEKPATSLGRPLQRLLELGLVRRELPFGSSLRDSKRTLYVIADPFLRFWFRFVDPERSRLEGPWRVPACPGADAKSALMATSSSLRDIVSSGDIGSLVCPEGG